jgi:acetolactate synthase-1/2/3 large subunit
VILVVDSDVPWIPTVSRPAANAVIYHIDIDPLKEQMPLWYIGARRSFRADAASALRQLNSCLDGMTLDASVVKERASHYAKRNAARRAKLDALERQENGLGVQHIMAALRARDTGGMIVLNEGITNYHLVHDHLAPSRTGSLFTSGGGSLGWNGGAAIGVKMAMPASMIVAVTGDGSYMFSVPSSVHWIARRYDTPFLQIVLNNGGWNAPRHSALSVHPRGYASQESDLGLSFEPSPDYAGIAAASGGAESIVLEHREDVGAVLDRAIQIVSRDRRSVVIDARLR